MTNPTPQELIQRLTGALDELRDLIPAIKDGSYEPDSFTLQPLESAIQDVSIALAQPEPQGKGVTFNQKIDEIWCQAGGDIEACPLTRIAFAEAIITHFARPAIEPEGVTDEAWQEFIEQVQHVQHVASREGEGPRFDLVECALALWREAIPQAPGPEGVTDEGILALAESHEISYNADYGRVEYPFVEGHDMRDELLSYSRALIALCARPTIKPVAEAATPGEDYHEDLGPVLWWRIPIEEPPWCGMPNDSDWPGYHTHFTRLPAPPTH